MPTHATQDGVLNTMLIALVACDPNGVIGKGGHLPWHYPEELEHFHREILGKVIIMGHKTYLDLPKRCLKSSIPYVFSREHTIPEEEVTRVEEVEEIPPSEETQYVIGGSEIFDLYFKKGKIDSALITHIKKEYEGNIFFPLHFVATWKKKILRENDDFIIAHYFPTC